MKISIENVSFLLVLASLLSTLKISSAIDTINTTQILRDGESLVSSGGVFALGFFSPGNTTNRYVGIWYNNIPGISVVWVANREIPLTSISGILKIIEPGILVLQNDTNNIIWSSKMTRVAQSPILQLLDSGNLVLREANDDDPENFLWQSFDYLSDTFLPSMNFGWNHATGRESYLSSWKSKDDPAPGNFALHLDPTGYPQLLIKRVIMNKNKTYYREDIVDRSVKSRITLSQNGVWQRWSWVDGIQEWVRHQVLPSDFCDAYSSCGAYSSCNITLTPTCSCLRGFEPKDPYGWNMNDWSNGCIRRTHLNCKGDAFWTYSRIKLPDSRYSWFMESVTLEECKVECLKNCSCMAYTQLDISRERGGCLFWYDLRDIREIPFDGQDIHIRMAGSELDSKGKRRKILITSLISLMGVVLLGMSLKLYFCKREKNVLKGRTGGSISKDFELQLFDLSTISKATNNFSINNKLGQGGYGLVYKGTLEDGQDIAVKRLSETSMQGLDEFKNEVMCIAKLQHRNLVKLLGCCVQGEEKMLVYEYMPNKSLDFILFDQTKCRLLDWPKRFHIISGIARGLMYLHQNSRMRIIHRDLKASNILLDTDMNPKISDFGLPRSFGGNETGAQTGRLVGTHGYMSPEYVVEGIYSLKSDVFSFGVLVLEIVSGKKNWGFSHSDHHLNLLGHAWILYKEGRSKELVDICPTDSEYLNEVLRSIHVGLLCVQKCQGDRPSMSTVVFMLGNEGVLPEAKQPSFFTERDVFPAESSTRTNADKSSCEMTITLPEGR
ncbi:G-type lectin S-receptor-like serine threonine-kinase At4g27290 isoform X1 [Olea europaea subsp. europaea]|uniref:Receptor-like serine/threonine-protein kinase n=1 Tax=Olea europaea subsp. europaea TaxID=158383 RepID=A0A8S0V3R7_OLEEU|nr:G-type lectin S-receptor-like serine threonine-kinase At4g27290 isoform X1 [Olea europaea subsp. europaea]